MDSACVDAPPRFVRVTAHPLRWRLLRELVRRIHFVVDDLETDVSRLRDAGARFRNDIIEGPGGKQILPQDPSGNVVELFQPAAR